LILFSLDFETTGLDFANDRVIENGGVLYSTGQHKCLDNVGMLVKTDREITTKVTSLTGITRKALDKFGYEPDDVLGVIYDMIESCDAVIGYNCRRFDYNMLKQWSDRTDLPLLDKPWIDLYLDLPWQVPTGKLSHVAADHGILNLFPHSALADCQTVLAIAHKYDSQLLLDRALSPVMVLRSLADFSEKDVVKSCQFRWNPGRKFWWKAAKEQDVDEIMASVPFKVVIDKDYTPEDLN
jgi:DNA polymerase III alpha subunit (gram-positive type)